jgi:hypothetical protein
VSVWAKRAGLGGEKNSVGQKVLCLHAGNLPLVGFQDALGTILSGADYFGKLSRKDPYLLNSLLEKVKEFGVESRLEWSTDLEDFTHLQADKVLFAGSEQSVEPVKAELKRIGAMSEQAELVIRTAKFSIAYITDESPETITDLVEAIFRYGGQGCRSVGVVVSPIPLSGLKCHFQDYIEAFWLKNPQLKKPGSALEYQFAYNKAIERPQAWMNDFLLQESEDSPELDFTLNWVQGDEDKVRELLSKFGGAVQAVYTSGQKIEGIKTEFLSQAQTPPLWWEPDGIALL